MRTRMTAIGGAALIGVAVACGIAVTVTSTAQTAETGAREIRRSGRPIVSEVKATDRELRIRGGAEPPSIVVAPNETLVGQLLRLENAAVIAEAVSSTPHLTAEGDWIVTDVQFNITEVLRQPFDDFAAGDRFTMTLDGGELQVGKTNVKAINAWQRRASEGSRYLLFVKKLPQGVLTGPTVAYEIKGDQLVPMAASGAPDEIAKAKASDLFPAIRAGRTGH